MTEQEGVKMSLLGERNHSDMHFPLRPTTVIGLQGLLGFPLKKETQAEELPDLPQVSQHGRELQTGL